MPAITTWFRLQGRSRDDDASDKLAQRVSDPLWLLARQWQLGEFRGIDGGSPIVVQMKRESAMLERFCSGDREFNAANAVAYDVKTQPLDAVVAAESVLRAWPLGLDLEAGAQLLRTLDAHKLGSLRASALAAWPVAAAAAAISSAPTEVTTLLGDDAIVLAAQCRTTPSGARAYKQLHAASDPAASFPGASTVAGIDRAALAAALRAWLAWCDGAVFTEPTAGRSWAGARLEYSFAVAAKFSDNETVLAAPSYEGTNLDWHTFDTATGSLGATGTPETAVQTVLPSPVQFRGMPATRTWEFEDARLDLGAVSAGPTDIARLLVLDFALIYGNDWFIAPLDVPVGALTRLTSLIVTDTFGVRTLVRTVHDANTAQPWSMFQPGNAPGILVIPPTTIMSVKGEAREDVLLLRDDGANAAWAVEQIVELASDRAAARNGTLPAAPPLTPGAARYALATRVPANWSPLVRLPLGSSTRLNAGTVLPADAADATMALSRLVTEAKPLSLYDEEVPREGTRITRRYRLARWLDGSTHLWLCREREPGVGQGASRLEYDTLNAS